MSIDLATPATPGSPAATPSRHTPTTRGWLGQYLAGLRMILALTVLVGLVYPLAVTGIAQLPGLNHRANGSLVTDAAGRVIGSSLIGQGFVDAKGDPLPQWFQSRPSAAGKTGWHPTSSGASHLGPSNPDLVTTITDRRTAVAPSTASPATP